MSYGKASRQAIADKIEALEVRNAALEAENGQLRDKSPLLLLNRMRLVGMNFAYFGGKTATCIELIREEFGDTVADTLYNVFHDMSCAPIPQEYLRNLEEAMRSGPLGRQCRP